MSKKFFVSVAEKEKLFQAELVKGGVNYHQAIQVAKVLARNQSEETLTPEEAQLTEEACRVWLQHRQRLRFIEETLTSFPTREPAPAPESKHRDCAGSY
ncbi:MAG TPA: hypothetical protein V6C63_20405 [Allocoleopsis sp.]